MTKADRRHNSFDRELRRVPTPEGMVARLKQIAAGSDSDLDATLGQVPVPEGLVERLKAIPADVQLDAQLATVAVPDGLAPRLKSIARETGDPAALRPAQQAPPEVLLASLRTETRHRRHAARGRRSRVRSLAALAAAVLLAVGVAYFTVPWGGNFTARHVASVAQRREIAASPPRAAQFDRRAGEPENRSADVRPPMEAAGSGPAGFSRSAVQRAQENFRPAASPPADRVAKAQQQDDSRRLDEIMSTPLAAEPPRIAKVAPLVVAGIAPPAVPQFPLLRLLRDGVHPFVTPAVGPLQTSRVPLVTGRAGYDRCWEALQKGRMLPPEEVRVEEFLAAIDYDFPPPRAGAALALRTAAGPSPFGDSGVQMVQVGVQAAGQLGGASPVAGAAQLAVHFNPAVVQQYRLLGHESNSVAGLVSGPLAADFLSGQSATALYEVKLKPGGGGDRIAVAELTWREVGTGRTRRVTQRISRLQVATSLIESPVSLQRAIVAAEAAEVLRNSPYRPPAPAGLKRILELTPGLPAVVRDDPTFASLIELIELAHRVLTNRPIDAN